ncbi:hypothetical protein KI387_003591, partial [Taxus chinensis]
ITNRCIGSITQLVYLETLILVGCLSVDDEGLDILTDGCKSLQDTATGLSFTNIKLHGRPPNCPNKCVRYMESIGKSCKSLQELSLSKCSSVMDEGISVLVASCRDLKIMNLTCCPNFTDVIVSAIAT